MPRYPDPASLSASLLGPQNRRDFLKRLVGAAASAAMPKVPGTSVAPAAAVPSAGLNPADILPPAFAEGFDIPVMGGQVVSMGGKPVMWNAPELYHMTKPEMLRVKAMLERANASLPALSGDQPLFYNHLTNQWHEMAGEGSIAEYLSPHYGHASPTASTWATRWLKAGRTAPPGHTALEHSPYLKEDFEESLWYGNPLTQPAGYWTQRGDGLTTDRRGLLHDIERDWAKERDNYLRARMGDTGGDARKIDDPDLLSDFELAPGTRFEPLAGLTASREVPLPLEQPRQPYMSKARKAAAAAPFLAVPLLAPREEE